jgi:protein TonB
MDPFEIEYLEWDPEGSPVSIHMHPGVVDGIARDVIEGLETLPRLPLEVGGLLLGRVLAGARPAVWIERYQRISCEHRFGPQFILDSGEITALEEAARNVLAAGELAVVGFYRSNTRPRFQLEESDFELIRRYFSDSSDLILLIEPEHANGISGQFHAWDTENGSHPVGAQFPFRGRGVIADSVPQTAGMKDEPPAAADPSKAAEVPVLQREYPRRLVPDFVPSPVEPAPSLFGLGRNAGPDRSPSTEELPTEQRTRERLSKWLPLLAALLLLGGILWFLLQPGGHGPLNSANPVPAQTGETARPIGLYVDPAGPAWRVLWNPNATALHDARNVQLFVREKDDQKGDDQNRIDLSARDLASGSYEYRPAGNDVTFRLEVIDQAGKVSAESFRLVRAANPPTPPPAANASPSPTGAVAQITQPKAIYKAPPLVAAGIRPRIKGTIPIDVRVHIDANGRVVSAAPVTKHYSGLDQYLAGRAVQAARLWRFEPARENGKAVAGTQIIHFVFEK